MTPWWRRRFLWPRIVYWASLALLVGGLLMAVTGETDGTFQEDREMREAGGGIGLFALAGVLGGKYWMDAVARSRVRMACPACGTSNEFDAHFCASCGARLRIDATSVERTQS